MPNKNIHEFVGAAAGGGIALFAARNEPLDKAILEFIGGYVAGGFVGSLPDRIDPPTSPNHRSIGHGLLTMGPLLLWLCKQCPNWQEKLRNMARDMEANGHVILAALLHIIIGAIPGAIASYTAHLALDATTPKSLPLIA